MLDFAKCEQLVSRARDKRSKPVDNNTRVEKRDDDTYALRLHATDIATFHRDGRITVNSGGYRTNTTANRLDGFVFNQTRARYSDRGVWYVKSAPDPKDPEPARGWDLSEVVRPFEALDPGPEPVKPTEGCLAGTESVEEFDEEVLVSRRELEDPAIPEANEESIVRPYEGSGDYFVGYRVRHIRATTYWREERHGYQCKVEPPILAINERWKSQQCPHCELFENQHGAWSAAMNGGGWGRNRTHGYAKMVELLERFGSREAWQEAYLANYRERRAANKAHREWSERNRVPFEDGMEIVGVGYAKRPDLKAIARAERKAKRIEKKRQRINRFVADAVHELVTNGLPMPSGGDCWYCAFSHAPQESEPHPGAISMGDAMPTLHADGSMSSEPNREHLEGHIRERYYVPSMFVNALRERGYKDIGIAVHLGMDPENDRMGGPGSNVFEDTVIRDLRKYLYNRLIPEISTNYKAGVR